MVMDFIQIRFDEILKLMSPNWKHFKNIDRFHDVYIYVCGCVQ